MCYKSLGFKKHYCDTTKRQAVSSFTNSTQKVWHYLSLKTSTQGFLKDVLAIPFCLHYIRIQALLISSFLLTLPSWDFGYRHWNCSLYHQPLSHWKHHENRISCFWSRTSGGSFSPTASITPVHYYKYLGVHSDCNPSWDVYVKAVCRRL